MRIIQLSSQPNKEDWSKRFVDKKNFDVLYNEDVLIQKPDGSPLMCLLKNVITPEINSLSWNILKKYNPITENRGVASGIKSAPRRKQDGTMSKVHRVPRGWEVISGVIGYFERTIRMPYCHSCSWNAQNPKEFAQLMPLIKRVSDLFKQHVPERWEVQKSYIDKTSPEFVITDTVFTTVTVNKNFRTACHKDAGDLAEGFSCMSVIREGKYLGGELVLPNWRVAANVQMGDLILFDAHEFHGNTQIIPLTKKFSRCSLVYYYREKMVKCLPIDDEVFRAKNRKEGDPLWG